MALDSYQKRVSTNSVSLPFRGVVAPPSIGSTKGERLTYGYLVASDAEVETAGFVCLIDVLMLRSTETLAMSTSSEVLVIANLC